MKKRLCLALSMILLLALAVPALAEAEEEPEYRLSKVTGSKGEEITLLYDDEKAYLPSVIQQIFQYPREDGELYKTVEETHLSYDEHGWVTSYRSSAESFTCSYDEEGRIIECINTDISGSVTRYTYTYDEQGYVKSLDIYDTDAEGAGPAMSVRYENIYETDGKSFVRNEYRDGQLNDTASCTCNEKGQIVGIESTMDDSPFSISITYDKEGRVYFVSAQAGDLLGYYQYSYYPLLTAMETFTDRQGADVIHDFDVFLTDSNQTGKQQIPAFTFDDPCWSDFIMYKSQIGGYMFEAFIDHVDEPQVTFDENGYLTHAEGSDGEYLTFTYEPVA